MLTPYQFAAAIEETSLNAWPALAQILLDGWVLRFANGYSRRNNSVNAVYGGVLPIAEKIARSEAIFRAKGLPPTFKLTPFSYPDNLDARLAEAGYQRVSPTSVQVAHLSNLPPINPALGWRHQDTATEAWINAYSQMNAVRAGKEATLRQILEHIPLAACYATIERNGQIIACGLGVQQEKLVGLFDIVTHPDYRRQGLGRAVVLGLMHWGQQRGAAHAYLQVVVGNAPAFGLYAGLGYREIYQYWYRVNE